MTCGAAVSATAKLRIMGDADRAHAAGRPWSIAHPPMRGSAGGSVTYQCNAFPSALRPGAPLATALRRGRRGKLCCHVLVVASLNTLVFNYEVGRQAHQVPLCSSASSPSVVVNSSHSHRPSYWSYRVLAAAR